MNEIDERILSMRFDNAGFEEGVSDTIESLQKLNSHLSTVGKESGKDVFETLQSSANSINFEGLNQAIDTLNYRFSDFGIATTRIIENLTDQVLDLGTKIVSSLTIDPVKLGWTEYNQLIDISRLMYANTSASIDEINAFTDRLNEYADKTKYNFLNMAEGAKQFVQATGSLTYEYKGEAKKGETVDVEKLVEGATNYLAMTGGSNAQLSNVLEVFSRALQSGGFNGKISYTRLVRNGAGGKLLENVLREAAKNMGREDLMDSAIEMSGSFAESFNKQLAKEYYNWANDDVIAEALRILSDTNTATGRKAYEAATEPTTLQEVIDQTVEAVQSSWTRTWRSIIGDLEEAKEIWRVVNYQLNGVNGALTIYSETIGSLAEEWKELGGRTDVINGLFDAFQGLYNIVCSVGTIFEMFFPGITAGDIKSITGSFAESAENFRIWTEDLRSMFGSFIGGYDYSKREIEYVSKEAETKSLGIDQNEYNSQLDAWIASHEGEIENWLDQFLQPEYFKDDGSYDTKKLEDKLKFLDWEHFMPSSTAEEKKLNKSNAGQARDYIKHLLGINTEGYWRDRHALGVMNEDYYNDDWSYQQRQAYLNILRELGYDTYAFEDQLKQSLEKFEEIPEEYDTYKENVQTPIVIEGLDYSDPAIRDAYKGQVDFINAFSGAFSIIKGISDAAKDIYAYLIKPLTGTVFAQLIRTISAMVGELGRRIAEIVKIISNNSSLKDLLIGIYDFIATNVDLNTFFDNIIYYFSNILSIIEKVIVKIVDLSTKIKNSKTFTALSNIIQNLWDNVLGPLIGTNKKAGMVTGGVLGGVTGAIKGLFTSGPIGMIIGGLKGFFTGSLKGGFFGTIIDIVNFLINNGPIVGEIFSTIGGYIGGIFTNIGEGFTSENNPFVVAINAVKNFFKNIKDAVTGAGNPLQKFSDFLKSDTVKNFFENLKSPFITFGQFLSGIWDTIYTNVTDFFSKMGQKWDLYMEKFNNNPFQAFINIVKDSALVTAIKTFFGIIADGAKALWSGLTGVAADNPVTNAVKNIDFKNLSIVDFISAKLTNLQNSLIAFKNGETFGKIKQFFIDIGSGIRDFGRIITSGDIIGIVTDFFKMLWSLMTGAASSFRTGVAEPVTEGIKKVNGVLEKTPLSEKLHNLKTSFDEFLQSDGFIKFKEGLNTAAAAVGTFFLGLFVKRPSKVIDGFKTLWDIITNENVKQFFIDLKDTIGDFFTNVISGLTGQEIENATGTFKEKVIGIFTALKNALKNFKESEGYQALMEFGKKAGESITEAFGKVVTFIQEIPAKLQALTNPLGIITDFFQGLSSVSDKVQETKDEISNIGQSLVSTEKKTDKQSKGFFQGLAEKAVGLLDIITGVGTASAATMDEVDALADGEVLRKQMDSTVLYGKEKLKTEEHTATLKGTTDTATEVNKGAPETEEANKNMKSYTTFAEKLGGAFKIIAGFGTIIAAVAGGFIFINAFKVLKSVFNIVGFVNNISGVFRATTILKYIEGVALIVASIAGLALVLDNMKNPWLIVGAIAIVIAAITAVVILAKVFTDKGDVLQDAAQKPLKAFQDALNALTDGIKDLFKKIGWIALIGVIVAAVVVMAYAVYKLATLDTKQVEVAMNAIKTLATIIGIGVAGLVILAKTLKSEDVGDTTGLAISVAAIGAGLYLVTEAITNVLEDLTTLVSKKNFKDNWVVIVLGTIALLVVAAAGLAGGVYLLHRAAEKIVNVIEVATLISFAISIIALSFGIKLLIESMVSLLTAVSKMEGIKSEDMVYAATAIGILIFAMSLFAAIAPTTLGKSVALRTSISFIALAIALKLIIGEFMELAQYMKSFDFSKEGTWESIKTIGSALVVMIALLLALAGAVLAMEVGGGKVFLRTSIALIAIVAAVGIMIFEIGQVFKMIDGLKGTDEEKISTFSKVVNQVIKLLGVLALAVALLKLKSIKIGKDTAEITGNSGFLASISALILIFGAVQALEVIADMSDIIDAEGFQAALDAFLWIMVITAGLVTAMGKLGGVVPIRTIGAMVVLIAGTIIAISQLAELDVPADDMFRISEAISLVIAALGSMTSLLEVVLSWASKSNKDTSFLTKLGQFIESLVSMAGIVIIATAALVIASNTLEDPTHIMEIAEAISLFMGVMTGIASAAALLGKYGDGIEKGLGSILKVTAIVGGITAAITSVLAGLYDWGSGQEEGTLGKTVANGFDHVGGGLKTFAGFLGELVAEFKSGAMVNDSEDLADMTENVSGSMATLSENLKNIDYPTIEEVEQLIIKFNTLRNSLAGYDSSIPTNAFQLLGTDLKGFGDEFALFAGAVTGLEGTVDTELLGNVCDALQQIFNLEIPESGFIVKHPVDLSNLSTNIGEIGRGLYLLYSFCSGITDTSIVDNVGSMITSLNSYLEQAKNYGEFTAALDVMNTIMNSVAVFGTGKNVDEEKAMQKLGAITWIMRSLASIMNTAGGVKGEKNQLGDLFAGLDIGGAIEKFGADVENAEESGAAIDKAATSVARMFAGKSDTFKGIGAGVGAIMAAGLKEYFDSDIFVENLGYIVAGLTAGLAERHEEVAKVGSDLATELETAFRNVLVIKSPSKLFYDFGKYITEGLVMGIEENTDPVLESMVRLGTTMASSFNKSLNIEDLTKEVYDLTTLNPVQALEDMMVASGDKKLSPLQMYMQPIDEYKYAGELLGEHVDRMAKAAEDQAKAAEDQAEAVEEQTKEEKGFWASADDFWSGVLGMTGLADTPDSKVDIDQLQKLYDDTLGEIEKQEGYLANLNNTAAAKEEDKNAKSGSLLSKTDSTRQYYESNLNKLYGQLGEYEEQLASWESKTEKQASNGWLPTDFLVESVESMKKAVTDNEVYQAINSLIDEGIDTTQIEETLTDAFGKVIPYKQLKRVFDGSITEDVLSALGLDKIGLNADLFKNLLSSANGSLEDLTNAFNLNFGTDFSEGQVSSLLENFTSLFSETGANEDNSGIASLLQQYLPMGDWGFDDVNYDSLDGFTDAVSSLTGGNFDFGLGSSAGSGQLTDALNDLSSAFTDSGISSSNAQISQLGNTLGQALGVTEQVDQRITDMAMRVISGEFGNNPDRQRILESMGMSFGVIQNEVNRLLGDGTRYLVTQEDINRTLEALGGTVETVADNGTGTTQGVEEIRKLAEEELKDARDKASNIKDEETRNLYNNVLDKLEQAIETGDNSNIKNLSSQVKQLYNAIFEQEYVDSQNNTGYPTTTDGVANLLLKASEESVANAEQAIKDSSKTHSLDEWLNESEYNRIWWDLRGVVAQEPLFEEIRDTNTNIWKLIEMALDSSETYEEFIAKLNEYSVDITETNSQYKDLWTRWHNERLNDNGESEERLAKLQKEVKYEKEFNRLFKESYDQLEGTDLWGAANFDVLFEWLESSKNFEDFYSKLPTDKFDDFNVEHASEFWQTWESLNKYADKTIEVVSASDRVVGSLDEQGHRLAITAEEYSNVKDEADKLLNTWDVFDTEKLSANVEEAASKMDKGDLQGAIDGITDSYNELLDAATKNKYSLVPDSLEKDRENYAELNKMLDDYKTNLKTSRTKNEKGEVMLTKNLAGRILKRSINNYLANNGGDHSDVTNSLYNVIKDIDNGKFNKAVYQMQSSIGYLENSMKDERFDVANELKEASEALKADNTEEASKHIVSAINDMNSTIDIYNEKVEHSKVIAETGWEAALTTSGKNTIDKTVDEINTSMKKSLADSGINAKSAEYSNMAFAVLESTLNKMDNIGSYFSEYDELGNTIAMSIFDSDNQKLADIAFDKGKLIAENVAEGYKQTDSIAETVIEDAEALIIIGEEEEAPAIIEYFDENTKALATKVDEYSGVKAEADKLLNSSGNIFDSRGINRSMQFAEQAEESGHLQDAIDKVAESYDELMDSAVKNKYSLVSDTLAKDREGYAELNRLLDEYRTNLKASRTKDENGESLLPKSLAGRKLKWGLSDYIMKYGSDHSDVTNSLYNVIKDIDNGKYNKAVYQMQSSIGYLENNMNDETFNVAEQLKNASEALDAGNTQEASKHIVGAIEDMNSVIEIYNEKLEKNKELAEAGWSTALSTEGDNQLNKMLREINSSLYENTRDTNISKYSKEYNNMAYAVLDSTLAKMDSVGSFFDEYDNLGNIVSRSIYDIDGNKIADVSFKNGKLIADNIAKGYWETNSITNVVADDFVTLESLLNEKKQTLATTLEDLKGTTAKAFGNTLISEMSTFADVAFNEVLKQASSLEDIQKAVNGTIDKVGEDAWNFKQISETYDKSGNLESILLQNTNTGELTSYYYENGKIIGKSYVSGAIEGGEGEREALRNSSTSIIEDALIGASKTALDSNSPSKVFIQIGQDCMNGLINGMTSLADQLNLTAQQLMSSMVGSVSDAVQAMDIASDENFQFTPMVTPVISSSNTGSMPNRPQQGGIVPVSLMQAPYFERYMKMSEALVNNEHASENILDYIIGMETRLSSVNESLSSLVTSNGLLSKTVDGIGGSVADLGSQMSQLKVVLNNDVLVGQITPAINKQLNTMQSRKERGVKQ